MYSIAILDFDMPKNQEILNSFRILNEKTHEPFIDDFGFVIINLTQFNKQEYELTSNFEKWLYVLRNLDKLKDIPLKLQQHLFVKLFNLAEYSALSKKEQKAYMESLKKYNDFENVLEFAQKKGYNKGYNEATLEFQQVISDIEMLLSEERKRAEEEKKRAEEKEKLLNEEKKRAEEEKKRAEEKEKLLNEEKKRAEQEKQRLIKSIQKMRAMGASDKEIEEILEIKLKEYE